MLRAAVSPAANVSGQRKVDPIQVIETATPKHDKIACTQLVPEEFRGSPDVVEMPCAVGWHSRVHRARDAPLAVVSDEDHRVGYSGGLRSKRAEPPPRLSRRISDIR